MLTVGLLWYDDDPKRPTALKIADGMARYRERLGAAPTTCYLNPRQLEAVTAPTRHKGVGAPLPPAALISDNTMRPNYFLIGVEESDQQPIQATTAALDDIPRDRPAEQEQSHSSRRKRQDPSIVTRSAETPRPRSKRAAQKTPAAPELVPVEPRHSTRGKATTSTPASTRTESSRDASPRRHANGERAHSAEKQVTQATLPFGKTVTDPGRISAKRATQASKSPSPKQPAAKVDSAPTNEASPRRGARRRADGSPQQKESARSVAPKHTGGSGKAPKRIAKMGARKPAAARPAAPSRATAPRPAARKQSTQSKRETDTHNPLADSAAHNPPVTRRHRRAS
jgi:hypothetical protein